LVEHFDIVVVGGGINGCGIARDAVGRGFSVLLAEQDDLASGTSSSSTKLIHGGLRYLEFYDFALVRESLKEREVLWAMAPHIIWPLRFVLPESATSRPAWLLRLGLFLYDHLGGRERLPPTRSLDLRRDPAGTALKPSMTRGFEYSDCWVMDSRLVVLNARDAAARGARIHTHTQVTHLTRESGGFTVRLKDQQSERLYEVGAKLVVNAAGPWVDHVLNCVVGEPPRRHVRLVQGSHIVVNRLYDHDLCYIFQSRDRRVIFAIPYEGDFTLIGTTDRDYAGDPSLVRATQEEIDYLCAAASEYFRLPVTREAVVSTYSGVRPLYYDGVSKAQEATREYVLKLDGTAESGMILNVFGGKITTYRRLAEKAMDKIESVLGRRGRAWTRGAILPGGAFPVDGFETLVQSLEKRAPKISPSTIRRLAHTYGTEAGAILAEGDLGRIFGADLGEREVAFLVGKEWARSAADILWRRTKLGLRFSEAEEQALVHYIEGAFVRA
ncbi:MAG TPA: glycerol-3-phosphate dehydrogenase, partial [Rhizomicrobium sp.]|nr:glycerol-3-phosphate dehydrogenase [Rhizomicrobium sp.]